MKHRPVRTGSTWATLAVLFCIVALPASAQAAHPGENGWIAFVRGTSSTTDIWSSDPDGASNPFQVTHDGVNSNPAFSPDGEKLAFSSLDSIYVTDPIGSNRTLVLTTGSAVGEIDWAPDGTQLVAALSDCTIPGCPWDIYVFGIDGTGLTNITNSSFDEQNPSWSPDGSKIAFDRAVGTDSDVYTVDPDGLNPTDVTTATTLPAIGPDWSPDGSRIAFAIDHRGYQYPDPLFFAERKIYAVNADGSGFSIIRDDRSSQNPAWSPDGTRMALDGVTVFPLASPGHTSSLNEHANGADLKPDWQPRPSPVPPPTAQGYPRPKGATPLLVYLVPFHNYCNAYYYGNRVHGPPLAYTSCAPPIENSDLTIGTADSVNGKPTLGIGSVRFDTIVGVPSTPEDEADVRIRVSHTDVRWDDAGADYPDYTGDLLMQTRVRITDFFNAGGPEGSGTAKEFFLRAEVPCAATAEPVGGTCQMDTSADAILPGLVREKKRATWQVEQVQVKQVVDGEPGQTFAVQGIFIP